MKSFFKVSIFNFHVTFVIFFTVFLQSGFVFCDPQIETKNEALDFPAVDRKNIKSAGAQPFGANLFYGNFTKTPGDGLNPNYVIMPGDRIAVYTWGSIQINEVFIVDGQGNIFIPEIGPVHLEGVKNIDLTKAVRARIKKVYTYGFNVYTNLITANPVGVYVTGAVKNPGRYSGIPSDSVLFFIDKAGGIDSNLGSYRKIIHIRDGKEAGKIDLYDFILKGEMPPKQFRENDTILVGRRGPTIKIEGDVADPVLIEFSDEKISGKDALIIMPKTAMATAVTVHGLRNGNPFNRTLTISDFHHEILMDGDIITVRSDGRADTIIVRFEGEFDGPSSLSVKRGSRLLDVLNLIPVNPDFADTAAVRIHRKSVAKAQKDSIEDSLMRLERSALLALSKSRGEVEIRVKEAELTAQFVKRARLIEPLGRVVTSQNGRQLNVLLEDNDIIIIPKRTNVIRIGGEVMMSQVVMYQPDLRAGDYINMAGGYSDRADEGKVIVLHANASVSMEGTRYKITSGDEILVPPEVDIKWLQNGMDIMQVIYQVAMSAAVIISLPIY